MSNDKLLSTTISYLRFPLIVGVIFKHTRMTTVEIQNVKLNYADLWPWTKYIFDFFSDVLPMISVPLFFFVSGFLFFYKVDFCKDVYKKKVKSRYKTLLVPYLIWNFIGFLILITQMHPRFLSLFPLLKNYRIDITEFISYFWIRELPMDSGEKAFPINAPLWFVRDLMLLVLASPIIYHLIKKAKAVFIILMGIVYFFSLAKHLGIPEICHQSIFFFPLGAFFSINRLNFVKLAEKAKWTLFVYPFLAISDTLTKGATYNFWFNKTGIMIGMIVTIFIVANLIKKDKVHVNKFLSDASFFVFAAHLLFMTKYMKALVMIMQPQSPYIVLVLYFLVPTTTILVCLGIYKLLYKISPTVAKTVTGGR